MDEGTHFIKKWEVPSIFFIEIHLYEMKPKEYFKLSNYYENTLKLKEETNYEK